MEHNLEWHTIVSKQLQDANIQNVDYRLIPLEHVEQAPEQVSYDPLPKYFGLLDEFEDKSIDFVLVDGHYRSFCVKYSIEKLRPGGLLVVDDTNLWNTTGKPPVPESWKCVNTSTNGIKTAKIWLKPAS